MIERGVCPNCGQDWTDRVDTELRPDRVVLVYVCGDCDAQYTVTYGDPVKEVEYL